MQDQNISEIEHRYRITLIIYFSQIIALFLYGAVGWLVLSKGNGILEEPAQNLSRVKMIFLLISAGMIPASLFSKKMFLSSQDTPRSLLAKLSANAIVGGGLADMAGIFGLVIMMITRVFSDFYPFLILALVIFVFNFPKMEEWKRWMKI